MWPGPVGSQRDGQLVRGSPPVAVVRPTVTLGEHPGIATEVVARDDLNPALTLGAPKTPRLAVMAPIARLRPHRFNDVARRGTPDILGIHVLFGIQRIH